MRQDLLEEFDDLKAKGTLANPDKIKNLLYKFDCAINEKEALVNYMKSYSMSLIGDMRAMSVFRDFLKDLLDGAKDGKM